MYIWLERQKSISVTFQTFHEKLKVICLINYVFFLTSKIILLSILFVGDIIVLRN